MADSYFSSVRYGVQMEVHGLPINDGVSFTVEANRPTYTALEKYLWENELHYSKSTDVLSFNLSPTQAQNLIHHLAITNAASAQEISDIQKRLNEFLYPVKGITVTGQHTEIVFDGSKSGKVIAIAQILATEEEELASRGTGRGAPQERKIQIGDDQLAKTFLAALRDGGLLEEGLYQNTMAEIANGGRPGETVGFPTIRNFGSPHTVDLPGK